MRNEQGQAVGTVVAELLARGGVSRAYTVPGETLTHLIGPLANHPSIQVVSTRHESGASFMATADARLTGRPTVALATRAVGAANLAIGVHTALHDSTPMVAIIGQVTSGLLHRDALQEIDLAEFYRPITKWSVTAHRPDRLPELFGRALKVATTGRPGPVMIAVPADFFGGSWDGEDPYAFLPPTAPRPNAAESTITKIAELLGSAERPVIIAGGGCYGWSAELVEVAESFCVGVYSAHRRQDVFPNRHPQYLGCVGIGAPTGTLRSLREADVVLVVGCRMSESTTQGYTLPASSATVVQVDIDHASIGRGIPVHTAVVADAGSMLQSLRSKVPTAAPRRDWSAGHAEWVQSSTIGPSRSVAGIDPAELVGALAVAAQDDALIVNDAGNFAGFLNRHWVYQQERTQLGPTSGAMGYAVPAAVAGQLALPDRQVVAVAGDGGFLMTGMELETATRYGLPIRTVVFRNGLYGTIAHHQAKTLGSMAAVDISPVDLAAYARSLGCAGFTVDRPDDLQETLAAAFATAGPVLIDVVVDPDLISPTARLSELMPPSP